MSILSECRRRYVFTVRCMVGIRMCGQELPRGHTTHLSPATNGQKHVEAQTLYCFVWGRRSMRVKGYCGSRLNQKGCV